MKEILSKTGDHSVLKISRLDLKIEEFYSKEVIQESLKIEMVEIQNYLISGLKFCLKGILL